MIYIKTSGYNFEDRHIARVLELVMQDRDELVEILKENNGCGLKKISSLMPNTTMDVRKAVQGRVKGYGLTKEEVLATGQEKEEGRKNDYKAKETNSKTYDIEGD